MFGIIVGVISLIGTAYSYRMAKKAAKQQNQSRAGIGVNRFGTDEPLDIIYGTRRVAPCIVYQSVKDVVEKDIPNETFYAILVWGVGPVDSISNLHFDDLPYTQFGSFGGSGNGQRIEHCLGHKDQTMPAWFRAEAPDDMKDMRFCGVAVTYVKLVMDKEFKRYPQGRPEFKATITARSANPIEALKDYFCNADYGCSFSEQDWDDGFNATMRNLCNTVVDEQRLFECNIVLSTDAPLMDNVRDLLQTCRGYLIEGQNGLRVEIDRQKDAVMHIAESMLTSGMSTSSVNINERYNSVTIRYPDKENNYQINEITFPAQGGELHDKWLAEDNYVPLTKEETVEGIDNYKSAHQYAEVLARQSRNGMTLNVSVNFFVGEQLEEMDVVTFESKLRGWEAKPFSVREIEYTERDVKLKLVEYQDSNYLWHPKPPKPDYPNTQLPNPNQVAAPSGLSFARSESTQSVGRLSWSSPAGFIESYDVRITGNDEVIWQQNTKLNFIDVPVLLSGRYTFAVRAIGAVAASGWSVLDADITAPSAEFTFEVDTGNTYVILRPRSQSLAWGTEYEFWFDGELRGRGVAWQLEGLSPDTEYQFLVRAVNAVGQSRFKTVTATTTNDASVILDIIGDSLDEKLNQSFESAVNQITERADALNDRQDEGFEALLSELEQTRQKVEIEKESIASAYAKKTLKQHTDELHAHAESLLTLYAGFEGNEAYIKSIERALSDTDKALAEAKRELYSAVGENESYIKAVEKSLSESDLAFAEIAEDLLAKTEENSGHISELSRAISDTENALAETATLLRAEIKKGDEQTLSRANEYTRAAVGYCIDKDGNITSHTNAVACVAAGHSWLDGPLAEFIRNLQVSTGSGTASVSQMGQAFVDADGNLVAKGSILTDVNGKVSGFVNTNNGEQSSLDIIADHHRIGIMDDGQFTPLLSLDSQLRELILRGRMILSDGYELDSKEAIQSQAGAGFYTLTLRNGVFPSDAVATQDFITTYKRKPVLDDHLTYRNTDGSASSMKRFTGSGWTAPTMIIHGDQVTLGTMHGNRLVAGTEVVAPHLRGGTGDFTGEVTAKDGSFIDKVEIGSVGGYRAFIKSVANAGHNMIVIENPSGDVVFSIQGNGNLYSIGGGYLNNLTIGENCNVLGRFQASQIVGEIVVTKMKVNTPVSRDHAGTSGGYTPVFGSVTVERSAPFDRTLVVTLSLKLSTGSPAWLTGHLNTYGSFGTKSSLTYRVEANEEKIVNQTLALLVPANTVGTQHFRGYSKGGGSGNKILTISGVTTSNEWFPQLFANNSDLS
ncbi:MULTISPECIES: hypothetical protein [unclassified Vibrio]|uniref:phage tail tip protein J-related protein n=1 Tax=unclassified Vibrio TaxID=2614977 RepID=UPI0014823A3D|nr:MULTISPECIES: hypothetical protein [unclassified Vibrio]NNN44720.1 hypothetical protein [Vibrio sp. 1-1(7)]NNN72093.1 hypothetical protein [Vibrio sp. 12-2(3-a)]